MKVVKTAFLLSCLATSTVRIEVWFKDFLTVKSLVFIIFQFSNFVFEDKLQKFNPQLTNFSVSVNVTKGGLIYTGNGHLFENVAVVMVMNPDPKKSKFSYFIYSNQTFSFASWFKRPTIWVVETTWNILTIRPMFVSWVPRPPISQSKCFWNSMINMRILSSNVHSRR